MLDYLIQHINVNKGLKMENKKQTESNEQASLENVLEAVNNIEVINTLGATIDYEER